MYEMNKKIYWKKMQIITPPHILHASRTGVLPSAQDKKSEAESPASTPANGLCAVKTWLSAVVHNRQHHKIPLFLEQQKVTLVTISVPTRANISTLPCVAEKSKVQEGDILKSYKFKISLINTSHSK